MAEFAEVMRQARRLCDVQRNCDGCPLRSDGASGAYCGGIDALQDWDDATTERIVMDWAEAHPEKVYPTWDEYQDEMFPNHTRGICPMAFGVRCPNGDHASALACANCRNMPMPAEIAEKLGIRPLSQLR